MNLNRNSVASRAWVFINWLPEGWVIGQDGTGRYVKVTDTKDSNRTIFHGASWGHVVAFCEGVNAGREKEREDRNKALEVRKVALAEKIAARGAEYDYEGDVPSR